MTSLILTLSHKEQEHEELEAIKRSNALAL